ncbi:MAG: transposase domain-containing protein [Steroidobacteraceae bacterium]
MGQYGRIRDGDAVDQPDERWAARASANLLSLVATAPANGLEPSAYLTHLFEQLPAAETVEALEALLP